MYVYGVCYSPFLIFKHKRAKRTREKIRISAFLFLCFMHAIPLHDARRSMPRAPRPALSTAHAPLPMTAPAAPCCGRAEGPARWHEAKQQEKQPQPKILCEQRRRARPSPAIRSVLLQQLSAGHKLARRRRAAVPCAGSLKVKVKVRARRRRDAPPATSHQAFRFVVRVQYAASSRMQRPNRAFVVLYTVVHSVTTAYPLPPAAVPTCTTYL